MALVARFYIHAQLQQQESKEKGRPIYKDVPFVELFTQGQPKSSFSRPVRESDKTDYSQAWQRFEVENKITDAEMYGTPISALPMVGPSASYELQSLGVFTVEEAAELDEVALNSIKGGRLLQKQARAYLAAANATEGEENEVSGQGEIDETIDDIVPNAEPVENVVSDETQKPLISQDEIKQNLPKSKRNKSAA